MFDVSVADTSNEGGLFRGATSNATSCEEKSSGQTAGKEAQTWVLMALTLLSGIMGILGNGLVIYFSKTGHLAGTFRHLNKVVRNLAIADFLFSILAVPCQVAYWYFGKFCLVQGILQLIYPYN